MNDDMTIRRVSNGAIVKCGDVETAYTFEDEEDARGLIEMLREISESFWPHNRHAEQQIAIHLTHGDKYECSGCPICKPEDLREV